MPEEPAQTIQPPPDPEPQGPSADPGGQDPVVDLGTTTLIESKQPPAEGWLTQDQ